VLNDPCNGEEDKDSMATKFGSQSLDEFLNFNKFQQYEQFQLFVKNHYVF
jgi:hypothetical protein